MSKSEKITILKDIEIRRGACQKDNNLQNILDALWKIADENGVVERDIFELHLKRLRRYFVMLRGRECVGLTEACECGRPLIRIKVLKREVAKKVRKVHPQPKRVGQKSAAHDVKKEVVVKPSLPQQEKVLSPRCVAFFDLPNVCRFWPHPDTTGDQAFYFDMFRANWKEVRQIMVETTKIPFDAQSLFAYNKTPENSKKDFGDLYRVLGRLRFQVKSRGQKDIDEMMVTDMLFEILRFLQKNRTVKMVVWTGDSDYAYPLTKVRELARLPGTNLTIYAFCWRDNFSKELGRVVDKTFFIEDYLNRIDPMGAAMLSHHTQKVREQKTDTFVVERQQASRLSA